MVTIQCMHCGLEGAGGLAPPLIILNQNILNRNREKSTSLVFTTNRRENVKMFRKNMTV